LESLEFARKYFDSPVSLCPDPSVVLRPPDRHIQQRDDLLFLSRDDHEGYGVATGNMHDRRFPAVDWTRESRGAVEVYNWLLGAARFFQSPPMAKLLHPITPVIYLRLAEMRFARGCELLGGSRVVVANRLHAHLMCLILGIPHFLSDTRYGKLRAYYKTWTSTSDLGVFCDSETDALEKAVTFLGTHRSKALP
jgi:pyruvyl transferase EpsO